MDDNNIPVADDALASQAQKTESAATEDSGATSTPTVTEVGTEPATDAKVPRLRRYWAIAAVVGFACCMIAWFQMFFNEVASIWLGAIALVLSILGVLAGRSFWRDLAITSILASAVLLLVYAIFFFGINILINSL